MTAILDRNSTWQGSIMPSTGLMTTETKLLPERPMSNDPSVIGLPDTPPPVICEYCGAERHTEGFTLSSTLVLWFPGGAKPCSCPSGQAEYAREQEELRAHKVAKEKAAADERMRAKIRRVIHESGMRGRFLQRTFQTFVTNTPDRKKIAAVARKYAGDFRRQLPARGVLFPGRNGFFITGTKGTGKTHIAAAIANHLLDQGISVICMTERNMFSQIQKTFSRDKDHGGTESEVREIYERVPLLIIDDLGKEKPSEWTLATLYAIVDGRYNRAMPLIITTNYDTQRLVTRLTPKDADTKYVDKTTAEAIVDRLNEMCEYIAMNGESWRSR